MIIINPYKTPSHFTHFFLYLIQSCEQLELHIHTLILSDLWFITNAYSFSFNLAHVFEWREGEHESFQFIWTIAIFEDHFKRSIIKLSVSFEVYLMDFDLIRTFDEENKCLRWFAKIVRDVISNWSCNMPEDLLRKNYCF